MAEDVTTIGSWPGTGAPRISIVVPAYNRERYLGLALESVQAQTVSSWELVIFDDGSSDATLAMAERYAAADPRIRVASGPNGGVAAARNRGLALTDPRTEFVIFLDSDDVWEPDALEVLVGVLDEHPEFVSSHSTARCIGDDGQPLPGDDLAEVSRRRKGFGASGVTVRGLDEPTTFAELAYHNWVLTPGTQLIRRDVLERVGNFDAATDPADDWDLSLRVSRVGDIGFVDRSLLLWRRHPETLTNTSPRWRQAYFRVRDKALIDPTNTPAQTHSARVAYVQGVRATAHAASQSLRRREWQAAVSSAAKAVQELLFYVRAEVRARTTRSVRGRRPGPARRTA